MSPSSESSKRLKLPLPTPPAGKVITRAKKSSGKTANPVALNRQLDMLRQQFKQAYFVEHDYQKALGFAKQAHQLAPAIAMPLNDIATCYVYLGDFPNAIKYAEQCLRLDPANINLHDTLSHAYGALGDFDRARGYGLKALQLRDAQYGQSASTIQPLAKLPPRPSVHTRVNNVISFSLFGNLPKYCETAILNAERAKLYYPHWICRFYVDSTVPPMVVKRLLKTGSQVIKMTDTPITPTLWRFLALDDANLHRVIFRDADSLLSEAEAAAVQAWIDSGKYVHVMRDWPTHTELILAGMWGAVTGVLTQEKPIKQQILDFMAHANYDNARFTDQFFLRDTQWHQIKPYMLQHDSKFGFLDAPDFPITTREPNSHIGSNVANAKFDLKTTKADGELVHWGLQQVDGSVYCNYDTPAKHGNIEVFLPKDLISRLENGELKLVTF